MPKVTVIVPNYNHALFLRKRIDCILQQTFQDFELILLDDCSTDDSRSILSSYASDPRVRIEFNDTNSGSTFKQWNKGVRLARGEYVWIAESDDYADPHLLERLVAGLDADLKVAFAYCRSWEVDANDRAAGFLDPTCGYLNPARWAADYCVDGREECATYLVNANITGNASSVVFRKAVYHSVGGVDETLRTSADWQLWAAMALTGKVAYAAEPLNYYRLHASTVRRRMSMALILTEQLQVIQWILHRLSPADTALQNARKGLSARWVPVLMSLHVPLDVKRSVLRTVKQIDPHPFRSALRPALKTVQRKFLRHWRRRRSMANCEQYAHR
ncbi:MAG: glycosyltransferase family A protein [Candidatus Acidiferrales bacterium]